MIAALRFSVVFARTVEANVISGIPASGRLHRIRMLFVALALGVGVLTGMVAIPGTAAAVPPGGYCYENQYLFGTYNGDEFRPYSDIRRMTNTSSGPVTWTESITVTQTFTTTHTTTKSFSGGLNFGMINASISYSTSRTVTQTITVSQTSTSSTVVNPGETKYMAYGRFGMNTTGTYYQQKYNCDTYEDYGTISGTITSYAMTSVGWRVWQ